MHYRAIFFDFDGVILDSVHVKTEAFTAMFRQYGPEIEQAVVDYHLTHGGGSRFRKFEYYYAHLLNKPIDEQTLQRLGDEDQLGVRPPYPTGKKGGVWEVIARIAFDAKRAEPLSPSAPQRL